MEVLLQNETANQNSTTASYNQSLRSAVSLASTGLSLIAALYLTAALLYHKRKSPRVSGVTDKMNHFGLFNSFLVSVNALVNFLFPFLIETFHFHFFCEAFFSFQIGSVLLSRSFTYALFWVRQHHFYKRLAQRLKCLVLFQKACSGPLFVLGVLLPFVEFYLLRRHSSFRAYLHPAGFWACGSRGFSGEARSLTYVVYFLQTFFSVALIVLVLIPIVVYERKKKSFNLSRRISRIGENIPRLSASILVASLSDLVFIAVAVTVQRDDIDVIIDKTLLISLVLSANMIGNSICLQCSFTDYKRRLMFGKTPYPRSNSNMELKQRVGVRKESKQVVNISSTIATSFTQEITTVSCERKNTKF